MIITDEDLKALSAKLNASNAEVARPIHTFSAAVAAAAKNADGRKLELLRSVRAAGRRLGVFLPEDKAVDVRELNLQLADVDVGESIAFKSLLAAGRLDRLTQLLTPSGVERRPRKPRTLVESKRRRRGHSLSSILGTTVAVESRLSPFRLVEATLACRFASPFG